MNQSCSIEDCVRYAPCYNNNDFDLRSRFTSTFYSHDNWVGDRRPWSIRPRSTIYVHGLNLRLETILSQKINKKTFLLLLLGPLPFSIPAIMQDIRSVLPLSMDGIIGLSSFIHEPMLCVYLCTGLDIDHSRVALLQYRLDIPISLRRRVATDRLSPKDNCLPHDWE